MRSRNWSSTLGGLRGEREAVLCFTIHLVLYEITPLRAKHSLRRTARNVNEALDRLKRIPASREKVMTIDLASVFGVANPQPLSYVERKEVDRAFKAALTSPNAIVVYGASKQGKTALVSRYVAYENNAVVRLTPATKLKDIYQSVLRQNGIQLEESRTQASSSEGSAKIGIKWTALIPLFGSGSAETEGSTKAGRTRSSNHKRVPFNLELPQDIGEILRATKSKKIVILENFHYLSEENQKLFAFDLRTFQEMGVKFVVLGVWREKNRMLQFNGDLVDRLTEIDVEPWIDPYLFMIAREGEKHLNTEFGLEFLRKCVKASFGSVGVFQEIMRGVCESAHILETQKVRRRIEEDIFLTDSLASRALAYEHRHRQSLISLATPSRDSELRPNVDPFLPYYFVLALLSRGYEGLQKGIPRARIDEDIRSLHPDPSVVLHSHVLELLNNIGQTQALKSIRPPIFDYDSHTDRLQVVDSTFYFYMKHADLSKVMSDIFGPNRDRRIVVSK